MPRCSLILAIALLGCAPGRPSRPPTHEELVVDHMEGDYGEVLRWCPVILDDPGADEPRADWCLFGYPAALRLALETERALAFVRSVCTDMTGRPDGDEDFRTFYVREVARWFALPLRLQRQDEGLTRALRGAVTDFSEVCQVDAQEVYFGLDTELPRRRDAGR
ncbi:hypothetical protein ENSA5_69450 [Enhygromyxa salina]|uniref:Lipoprotein n=1 Tax=Enhygromyxa salina TaxID=215803 RepID=A0A2S9XAQ8_9BACT|nr:hypothetical protein [Enhygromyxa salina]PRP89944.1 hypothetical protein ENSA5_69450 [Enhygromyxa salina]